MTTEPSHSHDPALFFFFTEQLHKNLKVFTAHVPAAEPAGTVSASGELLFLMSAHLATHSRHFITDACDDGYTADWCA